ncbi:GNAT family N-acetyltransferase [Alkalicoccobacillus murimartini]|uniref:RimJ/RimL family protein N-acetyltransferase n=1 Tax=Alkalicoccobacillus murimartini TaxID=171685 RepID=A0ABT9YLC5_9BACI|nr:GNAT family protein [Alkalicoccobacillus murimartini]MDQ0208687.1 RimJ/RimL family protein N-acetyltransferase [Alkalicoccobacillus murimartini]
MLVGKVVELRPVIEQDLKNVFKWINNEEIVTLSSGSDKAFQINNSMVGLEHYLEKNTIDNNLVEDGQFFSIYTKDNIHIGKCDYRDINWIVRSATLGIMIGEPNYWGTGHSEDTVATLLHYLFNTLNLNRVQIDTWSGNKRAVRFFEKCGFVKEGELRQGEYIDGQFYHTILMSILREEYKGNSK